MAPKCWAAVYGRPAPPPRAKKSEAAILVVSARDGAARRLVLVANAYVQPRGRAEAFEVTAGCCGRARHHRLRIRDFDLSRKMGPHDKFPGPCASTAPGVVSREVVLMSCGLRRARRRRAATTEPRRWRKFGGRNLGCKKTPLSAATAAVARPNSKFRPVQAIIPGENYGLYWADFNDRPHRWHSHE